MNTLLSLVDILIDGPFIQAEAGPWLWRGSRNQKVHFLTDRYRQWADRVDEPIGQVEITLEQRGYRMTGIWPEELLERLERQLER